MGSNIPQFVAAFWLFTVDFKPVLQHHRQNLLSFIFEGAHDRYGFSQIIGLHVLMAKNRWPCWHKLGQNKNTHIMSYNDGVNAIVKLHPETILTTMILNKSLNEMSQINIYR